MLFYADIILKALCCTLDIICNSVFDDYQTFQWSCSLTVMIDKFGICFSMETAVAPFMLSLTTSLASA